MKNLFQIKRNGSNDTYELVLLSELEIKDGYIDDIETVCNEPLIYQWIFRDIFPTGYKREHATGFVNFAVAGGKRGDHFIFLVRSKADHIVGCISIKNNDREAGEIGYWISGRHKGLATNGVAALCKVAKGLGFKRLFAQTKAGNERSELVLTRNGFVPDDFFKHDVTCERAFSKII